MIEKNNKIIYVQTNLYHQMPPKGPVDEPSSAPSCLKQWGVLNPPHNNYANYVCLVLHNLVFLLLVALVFVANTKALLAFESLYLIDLFSIELACLFLKGYCCIIWW